MTPQFTGFPKVGLDFLRKLKRNNNREWFLAHKEVFDLQVKAPMITLVDAYNAQLAKLAPLHINPSNKALYRIYRDTRFSKDKPPYKTHIAAVFPHQGMAKHSSAGFFFSIGADGIEFAAGIYMPEPDQLVALRSHIAENYKQLKRIIDNKTLMRLMGEMKGEQLTRPPKGFAADHPAIELLRCKRWVFYDSQLMDLSIASTPELLVALLARTKALVPFTDFLNQPLIPMHRRKETMRELLEF